MKKLLLLILTISLMIALVLPCTAMAFSSSVLSSPDYTFTQKGFTYKEKTVTENGSKQKIFYGEYNSTTDNAEYEWVIHSVRNGTDTTLSTVMDIAKDYEKTTNRKVMFAANGDYFYATGANVDSYVNNGVVITKGNFATKHCIGFDNNGKVAIGRMTEVDVQLVVTTASGATFLPIDKFNSVPTGDEIAVYTTSGTHTITGANKIVVKTDSSNLTSYPVYGMSNNMNTWETINDNAFTLRSGQFAVVTKGKYAEFMQANRYGVQIDLVETPAGDYLGCTWVLGGYDILVNNGALGSNFHTDNGGNSNAPRTFIGFKADGTGFVCMVDGRQSGYSIGITVAKEAELAQALGAKYALELDGGGSTTSVVRINDVLTLRNKPSDGAMRKVSNAIMLVEKQKPQTHEHTYVNGICSGCGEIDPNHNHSFVDGFCTICGTADPTPLPHEHTYVNGVCSGCGEIDPDHQHNFVEGVCTICNQAQAVDANVSAYRQAWEELQNATTFEQRYQALQTAIQKYNLLTETQKQPFTQELQGVIDNYNQKAYQANSQHVSQSNVVAKLLPVVGVTAVALAGVALVIKRFI